MVLMVQMMGPTGVLTMDEPGSLLGFLQNRQEVVKRRGVQSVPGLSFGIEVTIYDCLIHQLYRERVYSSASVRELATKLAECSINS